MSKQRRWTDKKIEWIPAPLGCFGNGTRWNLKVDGQHKGRVVRYFDLGWHFGYKDTHKASSSTIQCAALELLESIKD